MYQCFIKVALVLVITLISKKIIQMKISKRLVDIDVYTLRL